MNLKRPPVAVDGTSRGAQVQPRIAKVGEDERIGGPQFERPPVSLDRLAGPEFAQEIARPDVAPNQRRGEFHRALQMAKRLRQLAGLGQRGAKQQVGIGIVGRKLDTAPKTSQNCAPSSALWPMPFTCTSSSRSGMPICRILFGSATFAQIDTHHMPGSPWLCQFRTRDLPPSEACFIAGP